MGTERQDAVDTASTTGIRMSLWNDVNQLGVPKPCFKCNKKGIFAVGRLQACFEHKDEAMLRTAVANAIRRPDPDFPKEHNEDQEG